MKGSPARAGTPAPQCGTGVLARQIAENGLENVQAPGRRFSAGTQKQKGIPVPEGRGEAARKLTVSGPQSILPEPDTLIQ